MQVYINLKALGKRSRWPGRDYGRREDFKNFKNRIE
jgi:hypothetical protein